MAQISRGDTFNNGEQVTGGRLNQLVDSATLLNGSITEQDPIAGGIVDASDYICVSDTSVGSLRKTTVSSLFNADIPVVTSSVTAGSSKDVTITPNDAAVVNGSAYTSSDGLTVVVTTASPHGLAVGQVVLINSAAVGYNGTFAITVVTTNTFTYVMTTAATAGSGTLNYIKKGTQKVSGNQLVTGNSYTSGESNVGGAFKVGGSSSLKNTTVNGTLSATGDSTLKAITGDSLTVTGAVTASQVKIGSVAGGFAPLTWIYEVTNYNVPTAANTSASTWNTGYTSPTFSKPSSETWIVSINLDVRSWLGVGSQWRMTNNSTGTIYTSRYVGISGISAADNSNWNSTFVIPSGTELTSDTFKIQMFCAGSQFNSQQIGVGGYSYPNITITKFKSQAVT